MAELPALVEIITKLDCDVARQLAALQAQLFTGHVGGSLNQAVETLQNHVAQQAEAPGGLLGQFAQHVQETGGNDAALLTSEILDRLEWRKQRDILGELYNERKQLQYGIGCGVNGVRKTSDDVNGAVCGFKDKSTREWLKENAPKCRKVLNDLLPPEHQDLKKVLEVALCKSLEKCKTREEFVNKAETIIASYYTCAEVSGMHFTAPDGNNPFLGENRRLKLPGEPVTVRKTKRATIDLPEEWLLTDIPTFVPTACDFSKGANEVARWAEQLCLGHMKSLGFCDAVSTGDVNAADMGIDVVSRIAVAQVKANFLSGPCSFAKMAQFIGSSGANTPHNGKHRVFYCTKMSQDALEFASRASVAVFHFDKSGNTTCGNQCASGLVNAMLRDVNAALEERRVTRREQARRDALLSI